MDTIRLALALLRALFTRTPAWIDTRTGRILPIIAGGSPDGDDDSGDDSGDDASGDRSDDDGGDDDSGGDDDADRVQKDDDWRTKSRKNETRAKRAERLLKEREDELAKLRDKDKSEQQKAIDKAKEEARKAALDEVAEERRNDRLEAAVTKNAALGFEIEGDDDEKQTVRFADPDDAQVYIDRAISKGELDADDLFDEDGKVQAPALKAALTEILETKPHLRESGSGKPKADPDRGKGTGAKKDLEDMSVEEHDRRIREGK